MGGSSPSVFQTTPPQPASKARATLYSLSVGGAEASQNGFGLGMPAKVVRRAAMVRRWGVGADASRGGAANAGEGRAGAEHAERAVDRMRGDPAVLDRLDRQ